MHWLCGPAQTGCSTFLVCLHCRKEVGSPDQMGLVLHQGIVIRGGGRSGGGGYWVSMGGKQPSTSTNAERTPGGLDILYHKSDMMAVECSSKLAALQFSSNTKATPCCAVEQKDADTDIPSWWIVIGQCRANKCRFAQCRLITASKIVQQKLQFLVRCSGLRGVYILCQQKDSLSPVILIRLILAWEGACFYLPRRICQTMARIELQG